MPAALRGDADDDYVCDEVIPKAAVCLPGGLVRDVGHGQDPWFDDLGLAFVGVYPDGQNPEDVDPQEFAWAVQRRKLPVQPERVLAMPAAGVPS